MRWASALLVAATAVAVAARTAEASEAGFLKPDDSPTGQSMGKVSPVSTTLKCIINITIQYMAIYTALALIRTYHDLSHTPQGKIAKTFETAAMTVTYGPMLCVLFIACRMRVLWLTQGTGNPQQWVQYCMYGCSYAVLVNVLLVLCIPIFTKEDLELDDVTGDPKPDQKGFASPVMAYSLTALRYLMLLALYGGMAGVCVGISIYQPPEGTWPGDKIPPISPAVWCTMNMSIQFFAVYFCIALARTYTELSGAKGGKTKFEMVMTEARMTVNFAPMLCILFLGARMRALQMDPINGAPQRWAQNCFYGCTFALMVQTLLAVIVPLAMKGQAEYDSRTYEVKFIVENRYLGIGLTALRYLVMLGIYIGFTAVICSIFLIEHPKGPEHTLPISPTMQCVINLTVQYFTIYLLMWVMMTVKDFTGFEVNRLFNAVEAARATVMYCPMLSILFVGTRMRALQLSNNKGAPQAWAQDGMYMATWAVFIQFVMCLLMACFGEVATDKDGNVVQGSDSKNIVFNNPVGPWVVTIIRYLALLLLYGGIITVMVSIFLITPETATGRGSIPFVSDVVNTTPVGNPPPGVNAIPGVAGF